LLIATSEKTLSRGEAGARRPIPPGDYVTLSVTDTGTGMTPDVLSHLFEPFFTTKEFGKGTGLGLSTVYGIVQQSDGYVSVRSAPGKGTTFLMYFPRTNAAATATTDSAVPAAPLAPSHETILIVEDNDGLRRLAQRILTDAGYTTLVAEDPDDAMRVAHEFHAPIHLLLTDVVMPKTDGLALAHNMSVDRPDTRVLLMSGYSGDDVTRHGILPAGVKLLQKPFTRASLTHLVRQVLDTRDPLASWPPEDPREPATMT
jgi:CheY-like chemotaxis protein